MVTLGALPGRRSAARPSTRKRTTGARPCLSGARARPHRATVGSMGTTGADTSTAWLTGIGRGRGHGVDGVKAASAVLARERRVPGGSGEDASAWGGLKRCSRVAGGTAAVGVGPDTPRGTRPKPRCRLTERRSALEAARCPVQCRCPFAARARLNRGSRAPALVAARGLRYRLGRAPAGQDRVSDGGAQAGRIMARACGWARDEGGARHALERLPGAGGEGRFT